MKKFYGTVQNGIPVLVRNATARIKIDDNRNFSARSVFHKRSDFVASDKVLRADARRWKILKVFIPFPISFYGFQDNTSKNVVWFEPVRRKALERTLHEYAIHYQRRRLSKSFYNKVIVLVGPYLFSSSMSIIIIFYISLA